MNDRQTQIRKLLWKEVAFKSRSATLTFSLIGIVIFYYHFELEAFELPIKVACIFVVIANILRFWISTKINKSKTILEEQINTLRYAIWVNSIAWGVIFSTGAMGLNSTGIHYVIMVTILTGFVSASMVTLSYDKSIFFPFQFLCLVPITGVSLYHYLSGSNPYAHYLTLCFIVFLLYQIRQYKDYRKQLLERFNAQMDLEFSFKELKKSQSSLVEQTAKLIHTSKLTALSEMAGGLAHEVNNSLMVILASTQQIERELKKTECMTSSIESKFNQSTGSILKIKSVIEGLKYFAAEMEPSPKEVIPLRSVIDRTLLYISEMLKAHKVELIAEDIPEVNIYCHPFQITQILFNLSKNADDAMESIPQDERWLRYKFELEGECVLIKVINGGPQISPEYHLKLFQPFFTTKELNQGSGLSLSTARGIAKDHKGDLYFEDAACTTFVLKLPVNRDY